MKSLVRRRNRLLNTVSKQEKYEHFAATAIGRVQQRPFWYIVGNSVSRLLQFSSPLCSSILEPSSHLQVHKCMFQAICGDQTAVNSVFTAEAPTLAECSAGRLAGDLTCFPESWRWDARSSRWPGDMYAWIGGAWLRAAKDEIFVNNLVWQHIFHMMLALNLHTCF